LPQEGLPAAEERAAAAAAALLEEEEREAAAKAARKSSKRKKKKKAKQQGPVPPPEQASASPLEEPSESPDDTQVRYVSRHLVTVWYQRLSGVSAAMWAFGNLIFGSSSGTTEGNTDCEGLTTDNVPVVYVSHPRP
jgi:hypothetical protein